MYNTFISERIKGGKTDKENFDAKRTLEDGASNARSTEFFDDSKPEQNGPRNKRKSIGDQQDQNFSQDDNFVPKKR